MTRLPNSARDEIPRAALTRTTATTRRTRAITRRTRGESTRLAIDHQRRAPHKTIRSSRDNNLAIWEQSRRGRDVVLDCAVARRRSDGLSIDDDRRGGNG